MRRDDSKLAALRALPIFDRCTPKEPRQVAALGDLATVPAGRVLMTEGRQPDQAFVVVSGEAAISRAGHEVARVGAGEPIGEMSILDRSAPRTATVTAATEMELLVLDPRAFIQLLETHPSVGRHVAATLARRLRLLGDATLA